MLPDFGKHAFFVWTSYGLVVTSFVVLAVWSISAKKRAIQKVARKIKLAKRKENRG